MVRSLALGLPSGLVLEEHAHPWPQLVFASEGALSVETGEGTWVVPSLRAVWVPAGRDHALRAHGAARLRTLYLRPDLVRALPASIAVVAVPALLRELVLHVCERGHLDGAVPAEARLARVLVDQLAATPQAPFELPWPRDPRARRLATRLRNDPGARSPLTELAFGSGASVRTLERLFLAETGVSLGRWRQQARLLAGLERLALGHSVTRVALTVGYDSTSAFIAMFKRALGVTPSRHRAR